MDYNTLLDFATDLGYELSMNGAEIYRVEESISRVLAAYGLESEVFAIPNNLIVSILRPDGEPITRMRRIGFHGNDLDSVERYSSLSRRICAEKPEPQEAMALLRETRRSLRTYNTPLMMIGYFLAAFGFGIFFGGSWIDAFCGGLGGVVTGASVMFMDRLKANHFFKTMLASFPLAFIPYIFGALGIAPNPDAATIGTVMVLIPGLLFTYAMRDIIFGDTNSGVNRIVQVLMITVAIASGTAVAWNLATALWGTPVSVAAINHSFFVECIACILGCAGFCILFNVHGPGILLCMVSSLVCWGSYCLTELLGGDGMMAALVASIATAIYSEVMARIRKCPAIGYLVLGLIPLIPGSSLYYTMNYAIRGDMNLFVQYGTKTIEIAGLMAAGIILVSTTMRMWLVWKFKKRK